jgi:uncharacterized membrane protein
MLKVISISAVSLLCLGSTYAYAQDNTGTSTTPPMPSAVTNTPGTAGVNSTIPSATITTTPNPTATGTAPTTPGATTENPNNANPNGNMNGNTNANGPATGSAAPSAMSSTTSSDKGGRAFSCVGSNPNWKLSVSNQLIDYSSPKNVSVKIKGITPMSPIGDNSKTLQVYSAKNSTGKQLTILIRKSETGCKNGPPGQNFNYDAFVVLPNMIVAGCCNPA